MYSAHELTRLVGLDTDFELQRFSDEVDLYGSVSDTPVTSLSGVGGGGSTVPGGLGLPGGARLGPGPPPPLLLLQLRQWRPLVDGARQPTPTHAAAWSAAAAPWSHAACDEKPSP
ncbi:uncharacterized protein LOC144727902 [Lampetra planeri]